MTNQTGHEDILSEEDALCLNDEEVDELVYITQDSIDSLLGEGQISLGAELRSHWGFHDSLTNDLSSNSQS